MEQIIKNIHIVRYSLRSSKYHLDGIKVNGYTGRVTLLLQGPDQLARLTGMLLSFAEYAGVGIKTSLGMGGCLVKQLAANI
jgi:CRISPR/Cas system endoribonuclease Cas6 (RAMP superfamily)